MTGVQTCALPISCISGNQAITDAANLIEVGAAEVVVAGGAESLSRVPILVSEHLSEVLIAASKAKTLAQRVQTFTTVRPRDLVPRTPQIAEPTTGETMGEATERMAKENGISRGDQDAWALRSHQLAAAATADGRITAEIAPCYTGQIGRAHV